MTPTNAPADAGNAFHYHLELSDDTQRVIREVPLQPRDFKTAVYATCFDGFRERSLPAYKPQVEAARVEPVFADSNSNSPRAVGFRVSTARPDQGAHTLEFDLTYFGTRATRLRSELVRSQQIPATCPLLYHLSAYLDDQQPAAAPFSGISLGPATVEVPVLQKRRTDLGDTEVWDEPDPADPPVLISRSVLEEAVEESCRAPDREIGGVLLGNVCREDDTGEVFVEVSALVPGEGTVQSTETSVTFTPETWRMAREMIALRAAGEIMVGWMHSHPFRLCQDCRLPAPAECVNKILFYSQDDVQLMETTFDQPYMLGLLAAVDSRLERSLGHLPVRLFGWRKGEICARGFEVVGR